MTLTNKFRLLVWVLGGSVGPLGAQVPSDTAVRQLNEVVITWEDSPTIIPEPDKIQSPDVLANLDRLPGVFGIQPYTYPLSYRGQHGSRLRIEQNGARRNGVTALGYLAEDINPQELDKVQAIVGVRKARFGSGSLGGVLQIQTLSPLEAIPNQVHAGYQTNSRGLDYGFRYSKYFNKLKLLAFGQRQTQDNYRFPNGTEAQHSGSVLNSASVALGYQEENTRLVWRHNLSQGSWERPQGFQNNPNELRTYRNRYSYQTDARWQQDHAKGWRSEHEAWGQALSSEQQFDRYATFGGDLNVQQIRHYLRQAGGYRGRVHKAVGSWYWQTGADVYVGSTVETRTERDFLSGNQSEDVPFGHRQEYQLGAYGQFDYYLQHWLWRGILRMDGAMLGESSQLANFGAITGGLESEWRLAEQQTARFSLGRYFRYPTQQEASGVLLGGRGIFFGNPDLIPETSYELETAWTGQSTTLQYSLTGYGTYLTDRISEVLVVADTFRYENVAFARSLGVEATLHWWTYIPYLVPYLVHDQFHISAAATVQRGDVLATSEPWATSLEPLLGVAPARMRLQLQYLKPITPDSYLKISVEGEYISALTRIPDRFINQVWAVQEVPSYWLLHSSAEGALELGPVLLVLGARATNLNNATYFPLGTRIASPGRNLQVYLKVRSY